MQKIIVSVCLILALSGCGKVVDSSSLQERNYLKYLPNTALPFSGIAESYHANGQIKIEQAYKDGKEEGLSREWYDNGQLKSEYTVIAGEFNGPFRAWYENGQRNVDFTFKNNKRGGVFRTWHENGQQESEITYKNDEVQSRRDL